MASPGRRRRYCFPDSYRNAFAARHRRGRRNRSGGAARHPVRRARTGDGRWSRWRLDAPHEALAAALLFFVAFESTNVLTNVRDLAGTGEAIVQHVAGS